MSFLKNKKAFTLVELLIVIGVIGILATIVMVGYSGAQAKSRDTRRISDIDTITSAIAMYYYDKKPYYPKTLGSPSDDNTNCWSNISNLVVTNGLATELIPSYLSVMPSDPKPDLIHVGSGNGYCAIKNYLYSIEWAPYTTVKPMEYFMEVAMEKDHGPTVGGLSFIAQDTAASRYIYGFEGPAK